MCDMKGSFGVLLRILCDLKGGFRVLCNMKGGFDNFVRYEEVLRVLCDTKGGIECSVQHERKF